MMKSRAKCGGEVELAVVLHGSTLMMFPRYVRLDLLPEVTRNAFGWLEIVKLDFHAAMFS
jgi:hypothetical protein